MKYKTLPNKIVFLVPQTFEDYILLTIGNMFELHPDVLQYSKIKSFYRVSNQRFCVYRDIKVVVKE